MPITDRSQAKESGFGQVREALVRFVGDIVSAEFDKWGGKLVDDDGKVISPREFLEITCVNVEVLEVTEELSMAIDEWNFRVNCSDFKGSFWIEEFLASADKAKLLIPDGLVGKRVTFKKVTLEAFDKDGAAKPQYNSTNFVIDSVEGGKKTAPKVTVKAKAVAPVVQAQAEPEEVTAETAEGTSDDDPMSQCTVLAIGKTEKQFRSAVALSPALLNSPLLPLAKAGAVTASLVSEGKLVLVGDGEKAVYQLPS